MIRYLASFLIIFTKLVLFSHASQPDGASPQSLYSAASRLQTHLDSIPEPSQTNWKTHLEWDKWGVDLARAKLPSRDTLEGATSRFYGVREGLEHPALLGMRTELKRFLEGDARPGSLRMQSALIIRANTNILEEQLEKLTRQRVDQRDTGAWIAGAWVTGKAYCDAKVTAQLAPYGDKAAIEVRVQGTINTPHTIARSGSFQVHGSAQSQIDGVAYLYIDDLLVRATDPRFTVYTDSSVSYVDGPKPLRGIARRQAQKKQSQGESEGADLIANQATEDLKKELAAEVGKANSELSEQGKYHVLLKRVDLVPTVITTGLTSSSAQVGLQFPGGAADRLPVARELSPQTALEVSMHESLLSSFAANSLRGSTWTDLDFARMQRELTGTNSNEMLIGATPQRWGVRWDWRDPIRARITPEGLHYQLSFSNARIDGRGLDAAFRIKAAYRPISQRWGIEFHRIGAVEITSTDPNQSLANDDAAFLGRKFSSLFGETVFLDGLSPPHGGGWDGMAAFSISDVRLEDGWIVISSVHSPAATPPPVTAAK